MAARRVAERLIVPIGHLIGALGVPRYAVRIGTAIASFESEDDFKLWSLAHGDEQRVGLRPWTQADLLDSAAAVVRDSAERRLKKLLSADLLAGFHLGTLEAAEFARAYRLRPLMAGLGNREDDPDRYYLGATFRSLPSAVLNQDLFVMWRFAPMTTSLWDMAERFARQAVEHGADVTVEAVLDDLLRSLHMLLSQSVGHLDRAA